MLLYKGTCDIYFIIYLFILLLSFFLDLENIFFISMLILHSLKDERKLGMLKNNILVS